MDIALSLMVLAVFTLIAGAVFLLRRGGTRKQAVLMLVLAVVITLNIAIWTVPDASGEAPLAQQPR